MTRRLSVEEEVEVISKAAMAPAPELPNATCHNFLNDGDVAYCGVPRSEQPRHGYSRPVGSPESVAPYCPFCGLPRCSTCARESARRGRAA